MTKIIAEVGNNHLGNLELALAHVDHAARAGADIIKFQYIIPENVITRDVKTYSHVSSHGHEKQFDRWKRVCLSAEDLSRVRDFCYKNSTEFLCTPFCFESLDWVSQNCEKIKISSSDSVWWEFVDKCVGTKKEVLASTGISNHDEVQTLAAKLSPGSTIMYCQSNYPTKYSDLTLGEIENLKKFKHLKVGVSDHTEGNLVPIAISLMGLSYIEKHFILSRNIPAGDAALSIEPSELAEIRKSVDLYPRLSETQKVEPQLTSSFKRGLYYNSDLPKGHVISSSDIKILRPFDPSDFHQNELMRVLGKKLLRAAAKGSAIKEHDF